MTARTEAEHLLSSNPVRTTIVGRGRVGGALADLLGEHPDFEVAAPLGRGSDLSGIAAERDLVLLAVNDAAVREVAASIAPAEQALVVHFAGSLTLDVLAPHARRASLHPLSPMPGDRELARRRLRGAWMAIAGDGGVRALAEALAGRVFRVAESDRIRYHAAATIAASHVAALMGQVARTADAIDVPLAAYVALARATLDNVESLGPAAALTGPIARRDWSTIRGHLASVDQADRDAYLALAAEAARLSEVELPADLDARHGA